MATAELMTPAEAVISQLIGLGKLDETNTYILSDYASAAAELGVGAVEFYTTHYRYDSATDRYMGPARRNLDSLTAAIAGRIAELQ